MEFSNRTVTVKCLDGSDMIAYIATPKTGGGSPPSSSSTKPGDSTSRLKVSQTDMLNKVSPA